MLATISWQQQSVGNDKKMNQGHPHSCVFFAGENTFFVSK